MAESEILQRSLTAFSPSVSGPTWDSDLMTEKRRNGRFEERTVLSRLYCGRDPSEGLRGRHSGIRGDREPRIQNRDSLDSRRENNLQAKFLLENFTCLSLE